jgi:hypothetical protein
MMEFLLVIGILIVISGLLLLFGSGLAFAWLIWSCWRVEGGR